MPKNPVHTCPSCGAKVVQYRHNLSKGLATALVRAYENYGRQPFNPSSLDLTHYQLANWQKLRYFGLIQSEDVKGNWRVTSFAILFLGGDYPILKKVYTYRGKQVPFESGEKVEMVCIEELIPGYGSRQSHAQEAREFPTNQLDLLRSNL